MDEPPDNLPSHLSVGAVIGRGGSAVVWRARDRRSGRDVVVKVVDPGDGPDAAARIERCGREAQALARLVSVPGIAAVRAVGTDRRGRPWLVADLVDGPTLAEAVGASTLPADAAVDVLVSLASALAAAHAEGVVHGDVTPSNVVLGRSGPVLVDFGVGGIDGVVPDRAATPAFAAPERRRGGPATARSDVYGLGATVWAAVTGSPPERAGAPVPATVPASLARTLAACTAPAATSRPSATDLARPAAGGRRRPWWRRLPRR